MLHTGISCELDAALSQYQYPKVHQFPEVYQFARVYHFPEVYQFPKVYQVISTGHWHVL